MASRSCSNSDDKETSTLCLSHFLEVAGLAYIVTESGTISSDNLLNCNGGCNLPNGNQLNVAITSLSSTLTALSTNTMPSTLYPDYINLICSTLPPAGWNALYPLYQSMSTTLTNGIRFIYSSNPRCTVTQLIDTDMFLCSDFNAITLIQPTTLSNTDNMLFIIARPLEFLKLLLLKHQSIQLVPVQVLQ